MPRTARSLGVVTAGAALLVALAWIVVRTLVGPDVPVIPAAVDLGAPAAHGDAGADAVPADPPRPAATRGSGEAAEPPAPRSGDDAEVAAGAGAEARVMDARTERDALVVSPPPVSLGDAAPDGSPVVPSTPAKPPVAAPAPTVPIAPPTPEEPAPPTPAPAAEPTTSRPLEVDHEDGCAMPEQAGHGLGQAAARPQGSRAAPPPRGQHQRGCSVPEPAERPQPAATLPAPASARGHDDADGPGRGGGPGGAGRGRGPKG